MTKSSRQIAIAFGAGLVFGAGLLIGGMTRPEKILGFLDLFGAWDPSLAFVMAGAVGVHLLAYRLIRGRPHPLWAERWAVPTRRDIEVNLVVGSALFGIGWGLGGYCPGPALVSLPAGAGLTLVFVVAMVTGMLAMTHVQRALSRRSDLASGGNTAKLSPR